jgi:hypothetical protein
MFPDLLTLRCRLARTWNIYGLLWWVPVSDVQTCSSIWPLSPWDPIHPRCKQPGLTVNFPFMYVHVLCIIHYILCACRYLTHHGYYFVFRNLRCVLPLFSEDIFYSHGSKLISSWRAKTKAENPTEPVALPTLTRYTL